MKKLLVILTVLSSSSLVSAYTLQDCYKKYDWQGNPHETYYWFATPDTAQLTFTFTKAAVAPKDDIYEQVYDLKVLSPTNVDWAVYEPYEAYRQGNYTETITAQPGHAYGAYADISDNNVNPAYFYTYYPSLSTVSWSADGNTAFFNYDNVYGSPYDTTLQVHLTQFNGFVFGSPLPTMPIAFGIMGITAVLRRRKYS